MLSPDATGAYIFAGAVTANNGGSTTLDHNYGITPAFGADVIVGSGGRIVETNAAAETDFAGSLMNHGAYTAWRV